MIGLGLESWRGQSTKFNPLRLSPALWLDASDSATLFQSNGGSAAAADGDPVGYWTDKSGNAKHVQQTDPTKKPLLKTGANGQNAKSVLLFNGTNNYLDSVTTNGLTQPYTFFAVAKTTVGTYGALQLYDSTGTERSFFGKDYMATSQMRAYAGSQITGAVHGSTYNYYCGIFNGASTVIYKNTVSIITGNPGTQGLSILRVGANISINELWSGQVAELLFFSGAISGGNQTLMNSYLAAKWGL
jgi:hypothetical protein